MHLLSSALAGRLFLKIVYVLIHFSRFRAVAAAQALLWLWWVGLLSSSGVWASHCSGSLAVEWGPRARGLPQS